MVEKGVRDGSIAGIRIKKGSPFLSHLLFMDDALLFIEPFAESVHNIKEIISKFCIASGQLLNFDKSLVSFSANMEEEQKEVIFGELGISEMNPNAMYLGLPSFWGRSKAKAYQYLIERAIKKMQGWKADLLSPAEKSSSKPLFKLFPPMRCPVLQCHINFVINSVLMP